MHGEKVAGRGATPGAAGEKRSDYSTRIADQHVLTRPTPACAPVTFAAAGDLWTRQTGGGFVAGWRP